MNTEKERAVYHVRPEPDGEGWAVRRDGDRDWSHHPTQATALAEPQRLAQNLPLGKVRLHRRDGLVVDASTYGADPRRERPRFLT